MRNGEKNLKKGLRSISPKALEEMRRRAAEADKTVSETIRFGCKLLLACSAHLDEDLISHLKDYC